MTRILLSAIALIALSGCASNGNPYAPEALYHGTSLSQHSFGAEARTRYLEINLRADDSQLRRSEIQKLQVFFADYADQGHGPLMLSIPNSGANEAVAIRAAVEARDLAWQSGVDYAEIVGMAYDASGYDDAPMVLAFKGYDIVRPDCPSLAAYDFADARSNNDMPSLGCSVRANMAAMIADPADVLSQRPLEEGDIDRRIIQLGLFREGAVTGAERGDLESGAVSSAVN